MGFWRRLIFGDPADQQPSNRSVPTGDPDLDRAMRGMDAARRQPTGEVGKTMTVDQVRSESIRLRQGLANGEYRKVWQRRIELGYGVPTEGVPQHDYFWLNAAPALAGLALGDESRAHPFLATCCGLAEQAVDTADAEQVDTARKINDAFFN